MVLHKVAQRNSLDSVIDARKKDYHTIREVLGKRLDEIAQESATPIQPIKDPIALFENKLNEDILRYILRSTGHERDIVDSVLENYRLMIVHSQLNQQINQIINAYKKQNKSIPIEEMAAHLITLSGAQKALEEEEKNEKQLDVPTNASKHNGKKKFFNKFKFPFSISPVK